MTDPDYKATYGSRLTPNGSWPSGTIQSIKLRFGTPANTKKKGPTFADFQGPCQFTDMTYDRLVSKDRGDAARRKPIGRHPAENYSTVHMVKPVASIRQTVQLLCASF